LTVVISALIATLREDNMFEIANPLTMDSTTAVSNITEHLKHSYIKGANSRMTNGAPRKIVLPRRFGEPRFGPQPYYYEASRTGVLPNGCFGP
jgi:hypothetical protein